MTSDNIHTAIREVDLQINKSQIQALKAGWRNFLLEIPEYPNYFTKQGIVICGGGLKYFTCTWVLVNMLRKIKCLLPIEVWYHGNELSEDMITALNKLNVSCKDFEDYVEGNPRGFLMKPLSILYSEFEEVLLLDADNICVKDPSYLFNDINYKRAGCMFWPDLWETSSTNPIWEILDLEFFSGPEQESGQLIVNKSVCWKALNLCMYFNAMGEVYYKLLYGDKDTFKFAWLAVQKQYYMVSTSTAVCGYLADDSGKFNGITLVQHDSSGEVLFLHRNLFKWDITKDNDYVWKVIKSFRKNSTVNRRYQFNAASCIHNSIDIFGDVNEEQFNLFYPTIESECILILSEFRKSELYSKILNYFYNI